MATSGQLSRSFHPTPQTRNQCPTVRTVSERSFADESEIRKHLYEDHESDELGRIDTKRVEQYIDDHDLEESDDATRAQQQDTEETVGMTPATDRQSDERWELHDVQALSTEEIRDKLAEHGIDDRSVVP